MSQVPRRVCGVTEGVAVSSWSDVAGAAGPGFDFDVAVGGGLMGYVEVPAAGVPASPGCPQGFVRGAGVLSGGTRRVCGVTERVAVSSWSDVAGAAGPGFDFDVAVGVG